MIRAEHNKHAEQLSKSKRWCYDCVHFHDYHHWGECECKIYGWMGAGQTAMHPDTAANKCKYYSHPSNEPLWFEK